jgi:hypothetical protein
VRSRRTEPAAAALHDRDDLAVVRRTFPDEPGKLIDRNFKINWIMGAIV